MRASSVDQIILETLAKEHAHLTSHQVYKEIRQRLPAVNPSTVYRALERLSNYGRVSASDMGTGSMVYEVLSGGLHHHLICQKCGHVMTIGDDDVQDFFIAIRLKNRFIVNTNHLILYGVCEACQGADDLRAEGSAVTPTLD